VAKQWLKGLECAAVCVQDLAHLRAEQEVFASDGTFATLSPAFCPRCGWPLGHGQAALWPPGGVELAEGRTAELKLILTSDGEGDLYYSIDPDPRLRPVSLPLLHGRVPAGQRKESASGRDRRRHRTALARLHSLPRGLKQAARRAWSAAFLWVPSG